MRYQNAIHQLMLHKTRGIVLHVTDFGETSVVVKIYTELFGLQGFLVNSVRKKNAKVKLKAVADKLICDVLLEQDIFASGNQQSQHEQLMLIPGAHDLDKML